MRGNGSEKGRYAGVHLIRYADDFITGRTKELLEQEVRPLVEGFHRERDLTPSAEKRKIPHIEEGFDTRTKLAAVQQWHAAGQSVSQEHPRSSG